MFCIVKYMIVQTWKIKGLKFSYVWTRQYSKQGRFESASVAARLDAFVKAPILIIPLMIMTISVRMQVCVTLKKKIIKMTVPLEIVLVVVLIVKLKVTVITTVIANIQYYCPSCYEDQHLILILILMLYCHSFAQ